MNEGHAAPILVLTPVTKICERSERSSARRRYRVHGVDGLRAKTRLQRGGIRLRSAILPQSSSSSVHWQLWLDASGSCARCSWVVWEADGSSCLLPPTPPTLFEWQHRRRSSKKIKTKQIKHVSIFFNINVKQNVLAIPSSYIEQIKMF